MYNTLTSIAYKLLPRWLYNTLIGSWDQEGFKKYFANTGWMFIARVVTMITSFLTIAIVARYLGPENLGKLSYAQSFVAILSVFASLGIDQILYRDLVAEPQKENELMGTAVGTKFIFGFFAFLFSIALSLAIENEPLLTILIAITAFTFLTNPLGTLGILFQSKVQAKYSSQISIFLALFIPTAKLLIVYFDQGIIYFSLLLTIESVVGILWSIYIYKYRFGRSIRDWQFSTKILRKLLEDSWPLLLASLSGYIYGRIDQVMIYHFLESSAVGLYDVTVRITELTILVPGIIVSSVVPAIIAARKNNRTQYKQRLINLVTLSISFTSLTSVIIFLFSPLIIKVLFGIEFTDSVPILRVYVWSAVGTVSIVLIQQYLIIENDSKKFLYYSILGAIINVSLNYYLIPQYGTVGAAYATLMSLCIIIGSFIYSNKKKLRSIIWQN